MFIKKIKQKEKGILTYGITPPKINIEPDKLSTLCKKHIERIENLPIDALVIYDLQDEADRTSKERPFPFIETIDPMRYATDNLKELDIPKIVYRCVGKYSNEELHNFLNNSNSNLASVFVGAASVDQKVKTSLKSAYQLYLDMNNPIPLGGVTIPERHAITGDEHLRLLQKIESGCSYFISQAVYNVENAKNFLSDYYYTCLENEIPKVPILITLSPCGSKKTLEFMEWLGIDVPRWLANDLIHSPDILDASVNYCLHVAEELMEFCAKKDIPIGFNIESVSVRKVEIEASVFMTEEIHALL